MLSYTNSLAITSQITIILAITSTFTTILDITPQITIIWLFHLKISSYLIVSNSTLIPTATSDTLAVSLNPH